MNSDQANLINNPNMIRQDVENKPKLSLGETSVDMRPTPTNPSTEVVARPEHSPRPQLRNSGAQIAQTKQQASQAPGTVWSNQIHSNAQTDRAKIAQSISQMSAQDDDLIEKEWVDVTEKVIDANKDDPYNQDEDQHVLSKHYLKKRFNLDVK
ncbi:MAG: hypothetical protein QG675_125 [Patescibacteria group bacterium]|jgi:hypothetical protein|nr:hypothetical protein [Patescibacteria group bacterium]